MNCVQQTVRTTGRVKRIVLYVFAPSASLCWGGTWLGGHGLWHAAVLVGSFGVVASGLALAWTAIIRTIF